MNQKLFNRIVIWFIILISLLNIVDKLGYLPSWQIRRLIHFGYEGNIPTWFSSILLFMASFLSYKCATVKNIRKDAKEIFIILFLLFLFMSCDEVAQMHESLGKFISKYLFDGVHLNAAWVVYLGAPLLVSLFFLLAQLNRALADSRRVKSFIISGFIVYITGAFLLEMTTNFLHWGTLHWVWQLENVTEELFELAGVFLIIRGLEIYYNFSAGFLHDGEDLKRLYAYKG